MMTKIPNLAMALKPSGLGMPVGGHAFVPAFAGTGESAGYGFGRVRIQGQVSLLVRATDVPAAKTALEATGAPAWSPPTA